MKVLHVITSLGTGGAEKLLVDSIPIYKKKGIDVHLLLLNGSKSIFLDELKKDGSCNIYSLGNGSVYNPFLIFKIIPFLREYNIVHSHLFPTLYWVALAKYLSQSNCKLLHTEHNTHNKRRNKIYLSFLETFIYKKFNKIISISEKVQDNLQKWIKRVEGDKFEVIYNGVNIDKFRSSVPIDRNLLGIPQNAKVILMTARFNIQKDPNTLIKAFSKIKYLDSYLVFVGDGVLRKASELLADNLGVIDRVLFLGIRTDIPEIINMADICVLSSNWEGFGLVAVEYMASGKPTIVSNVEGLCDIVSGAGIVFQKGNDEELKNEIESLLTDQEKCLVISKKCYERSLCFGINEMTDSYINVYNKLCQ